MVILSILGLVSSHATWASSVSVQSSTVHSGSFAAQLDISACTQENLAIPDGTDYNGTVVQEVCQTLTAGDVDVLAGADVIFRAGDRIEIGSGFSVASGASFQAGVGPEVDGDSFVESDHPSTSPNNYWARFYLYPNQLNIGNGETFRHLTGVDSGGQVEFAIGLKFNQAMNENRVFVQAVEDGGGLMSTENGLELVLADGWHFLEVKWSASTGADNGEVEVCIDDSPDGGANCAQLTGLDNDTGQLNTVQWGVRDGPSANLGTLFMDDFRAQTVGAIGACTGMNCP